MDDYKVKVLEQCLTQMKKDEYYLVRVKGDDTKSINLDEGAVELLIQYYGK